MARRLVLLCAVALLAAPGAALAGGIVFAPASLPVAHVGVRYQAVISVSIGGHHPALGKDYPSYTVSCYGADLEGKFFDDCAKLPPGIKLRAYAAPTCSPPLTRPACLLLSGIPKRAGRFTFRVSAPDVASAGVRGIVRKYTLVVRPA